jgi:hypothetical protein
MARGVKGSGPYSRAAKAAARLAKARTKAVETAGQDLRDFYGLRPGKGLLRPLESLSPAYRKRIERAQQRGLIPSGPRRRGQMAVARGTHPHEGVFRQVERWGEARHAKNSSFSVETFQDWAKEIGASRIAEFMRRIDNLREKSREAKSSGQYIKGMFREEYYDIMDEYEPPDDDFGFFYE